MCTICLLTRKEQIYKLVFMFSEGFYYRTLTCSMN